MATPESRENVPVRGALVVFVVALVLRCAAIFVLDAPAETSKGVWAWGYEAGTIADSIATGHGFAGQWTRDMEPWSTGSGATAWLPPVYPALLAQLFRIFGGLNAALAIALFAIQSLVSAWTCVCLWALACRLGQARAGKLAAWLLCLDPASIWNAAHTVWDTTFVAFGLVAFVWALLSFRGTRAELWLWLGAGFGALLLVNPAPLALLPVVVWLAWRARASLAGFVRCLLAFGAAAFVIVLPWMLRNQREVGVFAVRTNFGVELRVGNNDDATGHFQIAYHPSNSAAEFVRYREMGEARYAAWALDDAERWIGAHPVRFVGLTLRRLQQFWIGEIPLFDPRTEGERTAASDPRSWLKWLAHGAIGTLGLAGAFLLARRSLEGRALCAMLLLFPAAYSVTHVMERYRFPVEPLLVLGVAVCVLAIPGAYSRRAEDPVRAVAPR